MVYAPLFQMAVAYRPPQEPDGDISNRDLLSGLKQMRREFE